MVFRKFMCLRGTLSQIQLERGKQLVAVSKQTGSLGFGPWAEKKGIEWKLVPTGGQHFNGPAEQMIGIIKKQMQRNLKDNKYSGRQKNRLRRKKRLTFQRHFKQ
jgi:hypothetical protein